MNRPKNRLTADSADAADIDETRHQRLSQPLDLDLSGGDPVPFAEATESSIPTQSAADAADQAGVESPVESIDIGSGYQGPVTPLKRFDKRESPRYNIPGLQVTYAPARQGKLGQLVKGMQQSVMVKDVSVIGLSLRIRKPVDSSILLKLQISYLGQSSDLCYAEVVDCKAEGRGFHRARLRLTNQSRFLNNVIAYETGDIQGCSE